MKRLARIPCAIFLGCALVAPVAASAQAANVELLGVRIGDRCVQGYDLGHDRTCLAAGSRTENFHIKGLTSSFSRMILLTMAQLVTKDDRNLIFVGQDFIKSGIDTQIMTEAAESVEAVL